MSRYQLSAPARLDLIEIRDFIAQDNKTAARKVLADIRNAPTGGTTPQDGTSPAQISLQSRFGFGQCIPI